MSNKKGKKINEDIDTLKDSRSGGQNALKGYTYQLLYSCYLMLKTVDSTTSFQLEGIEDIDSITQYDGDNYTTSIQLKYSSTKQDASFLKGVLKSFLEVYLLDNKRFFKMVYDFQVAKGNLSKLFESKLDDSSREYWLSVISKIKTENPSWQWNGFNFNHFISTISFERVEKTALEGAVEKELISLYEIATDNVSLFADAIKIFCLNNMENRAYVRKEDLDFLIQRVKDDISKGPQNPAHSWIRKIEFDDNGREDDYSFYEGKRATPADIVNQLPIRREKLEKRIIESIHKNTVTIIKASSGQGKTTLALQVAYSLYNDYKPYQLLCCDDIKEIGNTVQYFKSRIQLGERILIVLDSLDNRFTNWNYLVQLLQSELHLHFKLLLTTRETDWYNYCGDLSKIQSIEIIKPTLEENDAMEIFNSFKAANKLHSRITDWRSAWNKIAEKQLLIEYVYLLTHGEMLSERIDSQMSEIGNSPDGKVKTDILRKVCLADSCGIRLSVLGLQNSITFDYDSDFSELIRSMGSEFLVHIDSEGSYVEGLHPIRSKHVIDRLHDISPIDETVISVVKIAEPTDLSILFSHLPEYNINKEKTFDSIIEILWNEKDLSGCISAIKGLLSGSVMQYYRANREAFDDANNHNGLFIFAIEKCPFTTMPKFGVSVNTLDTMREVLPNNTNIEHLCTLRDNTPDINLKDSYVYAFCKQLNNWMQPLSLSNIYDLKSYAEIAEYIYCIDSSLNLSSLIDLEYVWKKPEKLSLECVASFMFASYCGNKNEYMAFVNNNFNRIMQFLKERTHSHRLYVDSSDNSIHVEYIIKLKDVENAVEQSVSRLKCICKILPIYDKYCSDALKPTIYSLKDYNIPDDAQKRMPIQNIVGMFHQEFNSLWCRTIMSNYELGTATDWLKYWIGVREHICVLVETYCSCMYRLLEGKPLGTLAKDVDQLHMEYARITTGEKLYPGQDRPFGEKNTVSEGLSKIKSGYFQSMQNFSIQLVDLLLRDEQKKSLALYNLTMVNSNLLKMQKYFAEIPTTPELEKKQHDLCVKETKVIESLVMCCDYYINHAPSKYFKKYSIQKWYSDKCRDARRIAEDKLSLLETQSTVHYPDKTYIDGTMSYYPIVIEHIDVKSEEALGEMILNILPFAETSYDYLVVMFVEDSGKLNTTAVQVNSRMLAEEIKAAELGGDSMTDKLASIYPVVVTNQMLNCFNDNYDLPSANIFEESSLPIDEIAEALWDYSKLKEMLTDSEDALYLADELQSIELNINEIMDRLKDNLTIQDVNWIEKQCNEVFAGKEYSDADFNNMIEHFI